MAMDNDDVEPSDGGATPIERRGSEPLSSFDPVAGFSLNQGTVDELRWNTYLSPPDLDDASLLESRK
jgi:hypothetical protein